LPQPTKLSKTSGKVEPQMIGYYVTTVVGYVYKAHRADSAALNSLIAILRKRACIAVAFVEFTAKFIAHWHYGGSFARPCGVFAITVLRNYLPLQGIVIPSAMLTQRQHAPTA
jgi:hypothetical protein